MRLQHLKEAPQEEQRTSPVRALGEQDRAMPQEALCGTRHLHLRRELQDGAERRDLGHRASGSEAPAKAQWSADEGPCLSRKSQPGGDRFRGRSSAVPRDGGQNTPRAQLAA